MTKKLTPAIADALVEALDASAPKGVTPVVIIDLMGGGKSQEMDFNATAVPFRPNFWIIIMAQWAPEVTGPKGRDLGVAWVRDLWMKITEETIRSENEQGDVHNLDYVHSPEELMKDTMLFGQQAKLAKIWGDKTERMVSAKSSYDPENIMGVLVK